MRFLTITCLVMMLVLGGCTVSDEMDLAQKDNAEKLCKELCEFRLSNRFDFSNASCLNERITSDWACQTKGKVNNPHTNNISSPCPAFIEGKVSHYVELDSSCELVGYR